MSHAYQAVTWNRQKRIYDLTLIGGGVLYLAAFISLSLVLRPAITAETAMIRGLATAAFLLLHLILSIGPLCRLDGRFLPLLYNRRHLGVTMFVLALGHGVLSIIQFHAFGKLDPLVSLLTGNGRALGVSDLPFQPLGFAALLILFLMAATSHDFWMANLTPPVWKALHMLVYVAYGLLVLHVAFGVLQAETSPVFALLTGAGFVWVFGLHFIAGLRERRRDAVTYQPAPDGFWDVGAMTDIPEKRAIIANIAGERAAIFKYDGKISAVSNVCRHQNGPLGEGRIIDGCITCPWHGYQYRPADGASPPPFTEKVATFRVRIENGRVLVQSQPNPAGTRVEPAKLPA